MSNFTHFTQDGDAQMVDISAKDTTRRIAVAKGVIKVSQETIDKIQERGFKKGDVLSIAQLAGIMGAKQTSQLIPLCHPIPLTKIAVKLHINNELQAIEIQSECHSTGQTGVEMEALTAVSVTALTVYDMCKSIDKSMHITDIRLLHKSGGKSGDFHGS